MKSGLTRLLSFYFSYSRWVVIASMTAGVMAGITSASLIALIAVFVANPQKPTLGFVFTFVGLSLFDMAAVFIANTLSVRLSQATVLDLRMRICRKVLSAPLRLLEEIGQARVMAVLTQDIPDITAALLQVPQLCIHLAVLAACLVYLGWLSPLMLLILTSILGAAVLVVNRLERKGQIYLKDAREELDHLQSHLHALSDGAKELKLHRPRRESFYSDVLWTSATKLKALNVRGQTWYSFLNSWVQVIYFFIIGTILIALPSLVSGEYRQILTGYALTILFMRGHIMGAMVTIPLIARARISLKKVEDLGLSLAPVDTAIDATAVTRTIDSWNILELRAATHTYYREKEDDNFTLGPVDITLFPGELVFLVGGNGSGKTTLAKMIAGLYASEEGELLINGVPVTEKNQDDYRQLFSGVFSDFHLFEILLGIEKVNLDERARAYLEEFHLEHKVQVKDGVLSTTKLSFGQRKRLALLTAYLEDRPIYIFDEWASGQDPVFKEIFYLKLLPELKARGKTVLVVSHDDKYYSIADRIIKLENGKVEYDEPVLSETELPLALPVVPSFTS
jgi:putative pyoverdin transport system ATP-binding/permease protein